MRLRLDIGACAYIGAHLCGNRINACSTWTPLQCYKLICDVRETQGYSMIPRVQSDFGTVISPDFSWFHLIWRDFVWFTMISWHFFDFRDFNRFQWFLLISGDSSWFLLFWFPGSSLICPNFSGFQWFLVISVISNDFKWFLLDFLEGCRRFQKWNTPSG